MSTKNDTISESTIARIAGNLLSGRFAPSEGTVQIAVATARAIALEVQRTTPKEEK